MRTSGTGYEDDMLVAFVFFVAAVIVVLAIVGHVPFWIILPAAGIVFAVLLGYTMRRNSGPTPPPQ